MSLKNRIAYAVTVAILSAPLLIQVYRIYLYETGRIETQISAFMPAIVLGVTLIIALPIIALNTIRKDMSKGSE